MRQPHVDQRAGLADAPQLVERVGNVRAAGDRAIEEDLVDRIGLEWQMRSGFGEQSDAVSTARRDTNDARSVRSAREVESHHHDGTACANFSLMLYDLQCSRCYSTRDRL